MKRFFYLALLSLLGVAPCARAQDAAATAFRQEVEENYKILKGRLDDLIDTKAAQAKRIQSLEKEIADLRAQVAKPPGNFATQEEVKRLAEAVQEIDKKREADKELILKEIAKLGKVVAAPVARTREKDKPVVDPVPPVNSDQPTFTYVVKDGDYLSTIAQGYREKGVNVTVDEILKVNPGLKATALIPGRKILIPDKRAAGTKPDAK